MLGLRVTKLMHEPPSLLVSYHDASPMPTFCNNKTSCARVLRVLYVWTLRTPSRPPKQKPDAPENQQRQPREVRDEAAAPRLAVRF